MKRIVLSGGYAIAMLIFLCPIANSQQITAGTSKDPGKFNPIPTDVFWLNLCTPTEFGSVVRNMNGRKRYEVKWKKNLSFGLININQFKYDYKINSLPFAAFVDTLYSVATNPVVSSIDLLSNPFFLFDIKTKSPNKERFKKLQISYDSAKALLSKLNNEMTIFVNASNKTDAQLVRDKEYLKLWTTWDETLRYLDDVEKKFETFLSSKEFLTLQKNISNRLADFGNNYKEITSYLLDYSTGIKTDASGKMISSNSEKLYSLDKSFSNTQEKIQYTNLIPDLIAAYIGNARVLRSIFSAFEINYETIKNDLLNSQCMSSWFTSKRQANLTLINRFCDARSIFFDLKDLYSVSAIQDDYLEQYLLTEDQYCAKLFSQFMNLKKVLFVDTTYITPTYSNMKNYDLIKIEFEKIDKATSKSEKYDYDIYIKGGIKVDFSAGIFGTFLKNNEYATVDSLDIDAKPTDKKMIRTKDQGDVNVGFGAMVNLTYRTGAAWAAPGLSFGLILDTKPSLQLLGGLSLSMGKSERLLFHAGYAMGFVKRIDGLPVDVNLPSAKIGNTIATVDRFLARPFFGLTYNLSKNHVFKATSFTNSTGAGTTDSNGNQQ